MAELELEAVLRFLRENGLSESESALMEDVMDKSGAGASELDKFVFPMAPPPPLLRIPSARRPEESSDDEFVSLASSTTQLCSSGIHFLRRSIDSSVVANLMPLFLFNLMCYLLC